MLLPMESQVPAGSAAGTEQGSADPQKDSSPPGSACGVCGVSQGSGSHVVSSVLSPQARA